MTLHALSLSGQRIMDAYYEHYNGSHISMSSRFTQAPPNFMPTITEAQVPNTPSSHRNYGTKPAGSGACLLSTIQSPYSFGSEPLFDTGDLSMPGTQDGLAGRVPVPYNITPPQHRRSTRRQNLFPKHANDYVEIEAAWNRLLTRPALPTDDFDELFFPSDQAAKILDNGGRICRVKASVTKSGLAEWVPHPFDRPCDHKLKSADSYRRHVINQHLGCPRGASAKQEDWIGKRRLDAMRSNAY